MISKNMKRSIQLLPMVLVCIHVAIFEWKEVIAISAQSDYPYVEGTVVERSSVRISPFIHRPVLEVRVDKKPDVVVKAMLASNAQKDIPDKVRFKFSGDPAKEVFLEQENHPIPFAIFGSLLPLIYFIWWVVVLWRLKQTVYPPKKTQLS